MFPAASLVECHEGIVLTTGQADMRRQEGDT